MLSDLLNSSVRTFAIAKPDFLIVSAEMLSALLLLLVGNFWIALRTSAVGIAQKVKGEKALRWVSTVDLAILLKVCVVVAETKLMKWRLIASAELIACFKVTVNQGKTFCFFRPRPDDCLMFDQKKLLQYLALAAKNCLFASLIFNLICLRSYL